MILDKLLQQATELRLQGNQAFKKAQLDQAEVKYSQAIHMLQKVGKCGVVVSCPEMSSIDLEYITDCCECEGGCYLAQSPTPVTST